MAFNVLQERNLRFLCCGHQHTSLCCRKHEKGIQHAWLDYVPAECSLEIKSCKYEVAIIPLDLPAILRVGACFGKEAEFAYTDFSTFYFIRLL